MKESDLGGLAAHMCSCNEAMVYLTKNYLNVGLSNGSLGVVKEIVYDPSKPPPSLPLFVFVDFGKACTGESFFPNDTSKKGWFPIFPVSETTCTPNKKNSPATVIIVALCYL